MKPSTSNSSIWNNPTFRAIFFQILVISMTITGGIYLVYNLQINLAKRGISTGFDFLSTSAGFGIIQHLVEYTSSDTYFDVFIVGLLNTILVAAIGIVLATIIGVVIGVARLSSNWLVSKMATIYIEIIRNIPLLLQILFWYFAVLQTLPSPRKSLSWGTGVFVNNRGLYFPSPVFETGSGVVGAVLLFSLVFSFVLYRWAKRRQELTGQTFPLLPVVLGTIVSATVISSLLMGNPISWDLPVLRGFNFRGGGVMIPEFVSLLLALSIYTGAFIAENVRSGIQAVSHGQTEAALSLGLSQSQNVNLIVLPQALRVIIPPLTNQYLNLTKNSSLATAIGYPDLVSVFAGTALNQVGQAVEMIGMTMAIYLFISLTISLFMNWYNRKIALVER